MNLSIYSVRSTGAKISIIIIIIMLIRRHHYLFVVLFVGLFVRSHAHGTTFWPHYVAPSHHQLAHINACTKVSSRGNSSSSSSSRLSRLTLGGVCLSPPMPPFRLFAFKCLLLYLQRLPMLAQC